MKAKYSLYKTLSLAVLIIPILIFAGNAGYYAITNKVPPTSELLISIAVIALCFILKNPLDKAYYEYKEKNDYDEFGQRKKKSRYDYSKEEQNALEVARIAEMERILSKSTIERITKKGMPEPGKAMKKLIGLVPVKQKMKEMVARMKFEYENGGGKRREGESEARHMVFFGAPGTGKTTVARILTTFLWRYKYIKQNKCLEVDGNFLKAGSPSDTAIKVRYLIRQAYGGVLFVDEAYSLMDNGNGCGAEAIATLIKEMEDNRDKFILIIAGYTNEMKELLNANPGFHSRIKEYLEFPDYNSTELREIFQLMANDKGFSVQGEAFTVFDERMSKERKLPSFGNARTVRNVLDETIDRHALNLMEGKLPNTARYLITANDISPVVDKNRI